MLMKAIEITDIHTDDNLRLIDAPRPVPKAGQVLIKVSHASVNRPDLLQRKGLHPIPVGASLYPGLDVSGTIVEIGKQSRADDPAHQMDYRLKMGDEVCALLSGGGYAEYAVADMALCLPIPKGLSMAQAASLPECVFTVWNNLFLRGHLKVNENILIHGGSSGIGSFAIQIAKAAGAQVITTAGSDEKCQSCLEWGADLAINYKTEDYQDSIEKIYGTDSIDVIIDMVGGSYIAKNMALLGTDGRHVNIAFLEGAKAEIDLSLIMKKRLVMTGSTLRTRALPEKAALARDLYKTAWPWIEKGLIKPIIYDEFPLSEALKAHEIMKKSDHVGKIILVI